MSGLTDEQMENLIYALATMVHRHGEKEISPVVGVDLTDWVAMPDGLELVFGTERIILTPKRRKS